MFEDKFIFSRLMDFVPWRRLQTCIDRYGGLTAYLHNRSNLILTWAEMQTLAWTLTPDTFAQLLEPIGKTWSLKAIMRVFQKKYFFE